MGNKNRFVLSGRNGKAGVRYDWIDIMTYIRDLYKQGKTDEEVLKEITKYDFTTLTLKRYKAFIKAKSIEEARKIWDVSAKAFPDAIKEFLPQFKDKLPVKPVKEAEEKKVEPKEEQVIEKEDVGKVEDILGKEQVKKREAKVEKVQKTNGKLIVKENGKILMIPIVPKGLTKTQFKKLLKGTNMTPKEFYELPTDMKEKIVKAEKELVEVEEE